ncbi:MAG: radical SAM protein [Candidatus Omnitrophica bacterium]|nr:radical SAM protein [Candidatus Omnitrophota bacterium]MDD5552701.1 radical SAM protein [Candidatus Omnitrophota bacterium]
MTPTDTKPPLSCSIVLLTKCVLKCKMCHMWKTDNRQELSIEEWKGFIEKLCVLFEGKGEIVISGGEPLLKEGVLDLVTFCKKMGLKAIMVSNAFLIDKEMAKRIAGSGLDQISISMDSYIEETHDFLRGVPGSYKKVISAIDHLKKEKNSPRVEIITVISGKNLAQVREHADWARRQGRIDSLYFQAIACPFFSSAGKRWYAESEFGFLWPRDTIEAGRIIDELIELKERDNFISNPVSQLKLFKSYFENPEKRVTDKKCRSGDYVLNVDNAGNVLLCCFDRAIGNIKNSDIKSLWYSKEADQLRTKMRNCALACNNIVNCFFKEE